MNRHVVTCVGAAAVTAAAWSAPQAQAMDLLEPYVSTAVVPVTTAHRSIYNADFTQDWDLSSFLWVTHQHSVFFRPPDGSTVTSEGVLKSNAQNSSALLDLTAAGIGPIDLGTTEVAITASVRLLNPNGFLGSTLGMGFGNDEAFEQPSPFTNNQLPGARVLTGYVRWSPIPGDGVAWGMKRDFNNPADNNDLVPAGYTSADGPPVAVARYFEPFFGFDFGQPFDVTYLFRPGAEGIEMATYVSQGGDWVVVTGSELSSGGNPFYPGTTQAIHTKTSFETNYLWIYGPGSTSGGWEIDTLKLTTPTIMGDINLDGEVNDDDLLILQSNLGSAGRWKDGNLTGIGVVSLYDAYLLFQNYSAPSAVTVIPEPASSALIALGSLCLIRRRTRC